MPLLRGKPFSIKSSPQNLGDNDEVFFFDLTNEIFTDYDEFFERVILCNSLLWTCECTGRNGLTYKEATESEESVRKALGAIPDATKRAVLLLVHQTKRSRIGDLCEEIMDYLKKRYQEGEIVEVKFKEKWKRARVEKVHVKSVNSPRSTTPKKVANDMNNDKASPKAKTPKRSDDDMLSSLQPSSNPCTIPYGDYMYDVTILRAENGSQLQSIEGNQIRRQKGSLNRDLLRLLLRQTCKRTTVASDDGYWVVEPEVVNQFSLGESNVGSGPLALETPSKIKSKRKRSSGKNDSINELPLKKRKSIDANESILPDDKKQKQGAGKRGRKSSDTAGKKYKKDLDNKKLTPKQKKKLLEKNRLKEIAEKEKLKKKKLLAKEKEKERMKKEKEEEKQKRKVEKEKEKERSNEIRKFELEFLKGWSNVKDDLNLEDLKELPEPISLPTTFQGDIFGDIVMVVEFLNTFGAFYDIKDSLQQNITYDLIENALQEHDAEGVLYDILKFLLQTFFTVTKEENEVDEDDNESNSGTATPAEPDPEQEIVEQPESGHVSSNATAAAAWAMLHQGMALEELTIDPFTLSEVLRLHILSSGVKIGGPRNMWQRKGGFQFSDDPCVDFRHKEKSILTTLHTGCIYDLPVEDKLKLLCVLCNQILTLSTTRDYIEDSLEKVKELKKKLRELQNAEHKRRKLDSAERWRKKMEESAKRKEEIENRKKEKEARENESKKGDEIANESKLKQASSKKSKKPNGEKKEDENLSQDSKSSQLVDRVEEAGSKKEDETAENQEEEELRRREEYKRQEKELIEEISKYSSVRSEEPLGLDRLYSRYWSFTSTDGLFIEADQDAKVLTEAIRDGEIDDDYTDDISVKDENDSYSQIFTSEKDDEPKVTLKDIVTQRKCGKSCADILFLRYGCKLEEGRRRLVSESKTITSIIENVDKGMDPCVYAERPVLHWSAYSDHNQLGELIYGLNPRGVRELKLKTKLQKMKDKIESKIDSCLIFKSVEVKTARLKPPRGDIVDKSLFRTMEDYLEANLRDQLLDLEERLWQASLGIIKVDDRNIWRDGIASKINDLLMGKVDQHDDIIYRAGNGARENISEEDKRGVLEDVRSPNLENGISRNYVVDATMESDEDMESEMSQDDSMNSEHDVNEVKISKALLKKTLPLKFTDQTNLKMEDSRCNTPVNVSTPAINPNVRLLSSVLLEIERGIDQKYLKPPIGEDEEIKRERIREMIEASHADNIGKSTKAKRDSSSLKKKSNKGDMNGNEDEPVDENEEQMSVASSASEEAMRKEVTCLERWKASLSTTTNLSQIFIHLNTLDRSVMWDKSVLNARCRICRKKGDAEKMLLCDGCDRGFHMYCLKPPVKKVPEGDWYCSDCRPKETKRVSRPRKRPSKLDEYVDDIEVEQSVEDSGSEETSESEQDESDQEEESDEEPVDEHDDFCAVCGDHGDLLCCDICSRAFHINCVYPPIRKVPKGDWSCQVCTGADSDLPKVRRVATIEREREKRAINELKILKQGSVKPRKSNDAQKKAADNRKRYSSPGPSRKQKLNKSVRGQQSSRRSIGDPTAISSRRFSAFGRYERRLCSKITEELISADDGLPFVLPVDTKVVADYLDFIDHPMDLSKIKQKLSDGSYDALQAFIDDVRLMFTNCETYNQPRSVIARAGSRLSIYFEQRLRELELVKL